MIHLIQLLPREVTRRKSLFRRLATRYYLVPSASQGPVSGASGLSKIIEHLHPKRLPKGLVRVWSPDSREQVAVRYSPDEITEQEFEGWLEKILES